MRIFKKKIKCFEIVPAKMEQPCREFRTKVKAIRKSMVTVTNNNNNKAKAILYYCPVVSRAGTDIQAAEQKLQVYRGARIALVVLHHTFNPESIVPDSSRAVSKEEVFVVDCLFHEDSGLLKCNKNEEAVKKIADWLHEVKHQLKGQKQKEKQPQKKETQKDKKEKNRKGNQKKSKSNNSKL